MERTFTLEEANDVLDRIRPDVDELIVVRGDLATRASAHNAGEDVSIPDIKALEARMGEILDGFRARGVQVKGYAPLLLDFPMGGPHDGVLLCWLEGEGEVGWCHPTDVGFMGRRPVADLRG